jgi:hypothetical protein
MLESLQIVVDPSQQANRDDKKDIGFEIVSLNLKK